MNKLSIPLMSVVLLLCSCSSHEFDTLDKELLRVDEYERQFNRKADSLRLELTFAYTDSTRWATSYELSDHYKKYNLDSTAKYVEAMIVSCPPDPEKLLVTNLCVVQNRISFGRHKEAVALFESLTLPDTAPQPLVSLYYTTGYDCYSQNFGEPSVSPEYPAKYARNAHDFWLRDSTSAASIDIHSRYVRRLGNKEEAIRLLESIPREAMTAREYAQIEHHLGATYRLVGDEGKYVEHMVNSACQDIRNNTKVYVSLNYIATYLFKHGDPRRANKYVDKAIHDAVECNHPLGIKNCAALGLDVNDELSRLDKVQNIHLFSFLLVLLLFLTIVLFLLFRINRLLKKLSKSNEDLEQKTLLLDEASVIKDGFLGSSLELAATYIQKVDEERKAMRRTLKQGGLEALSVALRSPAYSDSEHINFYAKFDETFTSLFPGFVDELNKLMKEEKQFRMDESGALTTELRILALIRLGIEESQRIAGILFVSVGTVYTYRCNMRMAARCRPEEFEDRVKTISCPGIS